MEFGFECELFNHVALMICQSVALCYVVKYIGVLAFSDPR
jgi:hypothetical protein